MASSGTGRTRRTSVFCGAVAAAALLAASPAAALTPGLELVTEARPFLLFAVGALGLVEAGRGSGRV